MKKQIGEEKINMKEKVFAAKEVVFREGDLGECFYDIVSGTAGVYLSYGEPEQNKPTHKTQKAGDISPLFRALLRTVFLLRPGTCSPG